LVSDLSQMLGKLGGGQIGRLKLEEKGNKSGKKLTIPVVKPGNQVGREKKMGGAVGGGDWDCNYPESKLWLAIKETVLRKEYNHWKKR